MLTIILWILLGGLAAYLALKYNYDNLHKEIEKYPTDALLKIFEIILSGVVSLIVISLDVSRKWREDKTQNILTNLIKKICNKKDK